ncbi:MULTISPECIES: hypothetical protein [Okeania]|nr:MULTISPECIES: hypothetical protein [Okeania]NES92407.1 hypothetical protein [Okeania sp. SIO2B9]
MLKKYAWQGEKLGVRSQESGVRSQESVETRNDRGGRRENFKSDFSAPA